MGGYRLPNILFLMFIRVLRFSVALVDSHSLRFFRMMIKSVLSSSKLVIYSVGVIASTLLTFSVGTEMGVVLYLERHSSGSIESWYLAELGEYYGSVPIAFVSFFMCVTGGMDWRDSLAPLRDLPWIYTLGFLCGICFVVLGVLNVVTGIFVDSAYTFTQNDREEMVRSQVRDEESWVKEISGIFLDADTDHSGTLTWEEFGEFIQHPVLSAYFRSLEIDFSEAKGLFTLLDVEGAGQIQIDDFVKGCRFLRGNAKSIDLATLRYELKRAIGSWKAFSDRAEAQLSEIGERLSELHGDSDGDERLRELL